MLSKTKVKLLAFFLCIIHAHSFEFQDAGESGVVFIPTTSGIQIVEVDENNDGSEVIIVKIVDVKSSLTFIIQSGEENGLNPQFEKIDDQSYYLKGVRLDYEKLISPQILLTISEQDDNNTSQKYLNVRIINLDDEPPTLSVSSCQMEENNPYDVTTTPCIFSVSDPDGWLSFMKYEIIGKTNESDIFEFVYDGEPDNYTKSTDLYLVLQSGVELDYEVVTLYTFVVQATDSASHPTTPANISIIVQVIDMPDTPPVWIYFPYASRITEKTETTLQVSAKDGDFGIDNEINYMIDIDPTNGNVTIDVNTGLITITYIDRDSGHDQVIFSVTAYEKVDENSTLSDSITLLVEDLDDNIPEISVSKNTADDVRPNGCEQPTEITIDNERKSVIISICERATEIANLELSANDIDLGENALYTAILKNRNDGDFLQGFQVIPGRGYEQSTLTLTISDPNLLDYEEEAWKTIEIDLYTEGTKTSTNNDNLPITINLIDWNDEYPIFNQSEYTIKILESIPINTVITVIQATDRDQEDIDKGVKHEIVGAFSQSIVEILPFGGSIRTILDKSFDHEKQDEVYIQIRATDAVGHIATALLTVNVIDVNDKDPRLMVSSVAEIEENQDDGTPLDVTISASDDDTTADLYFYIDWDLSYATKNSMRISVDNFNEYEGCVNVATIEGETNHIAYANLSIHETVPKNTPDFEIFDTLFIRLIVIDKGTEIGNGTDSSLVVINIKDLNDNPPDLSSNEDKTWRVTENSPDGTIIGSITYYDPDTVGEVTLSIAPNDADTPKWVTIDPKTGTLSVLIQELDELDCDQPVRYDLKYKITADDTVFQTSIEIAISITDENENSPYLDETLNNHLTYHIDEDYGNNPDVTSDGNVVTDLIPTDIDRDEPYHTVRCAFQSSNTPQQVSNRFDIKEDLRIVVALQGGADLDREKQANYTFQLNCFDDPNRTGPRSNTASPPPVVTIILDDVNDNVPIITTTSGFIFSEIDEKGANLRIEGRDDDEDENGMIDFTLKGYKRFSDKDHTTELNPIDGLFTIETENTHKSAILSVAAENLKDCFGYYLLNIETKDRGEVPLFQDNTVELRVTPYNFKEIIFVFPENSKTYYISPVQHANTPVLMYTNSDYLSSLNATDNGQNKYLITYNIYDDKNVFKVNGVNIVPTTNDLDESTIYTVTVEASLDSDTIIQSGEAAHKKNCTIDFQIFAQDTAEPVFQNHAGLVSIKENDDSLSYQLEPINYPDVDLPDLPKYYLMPQGDTKIFNLDRQSGLITLLQTLDYEVQTSYILVIQASRTTSLNQEASDLSKFTLTVNVIDVNDNPPIFDYRAYYGTVVTSTAANTGILTVSATDIDTTSQGKLRYFIDGISGSNSDLNKLSKPFEIDTITGIITSKTVITDTLKGYFNLSLRVMDEAPENHIDTVGAQIYIVSNDNTVNFKFQNDLEDVRSKTDNITRILDDYFLYLSHVHNPSTYTDDGTTLTPIYFIDKNVPVDGSVILAKVTNTQEFQKLSALFKAEQLYLVNFQSSSESNNNMQEIFKAWLIGVCVVLGALCLILSVAFILKTRSLNQRITKLSNTKFGSQESGLNRQGVTAPTTNKHAIEGSNPVYNNEVNPKDLDRASITSGDSDLIGVEDDEKFDYDYPTKDEVIQ